MAFTTTNPYVTVSDSLGAPFGGFGTGYFVYGRHGFVNWNVAGYPELEQTAEYPRGTRWHYYTDDAEAAPVALTLKKGGKTSLLQARSCAFAEGTPCTEFDMRVYMPFGRASMRTDDTTRVELLLYSSMKPHDVDATSIPTCVMEFTLCNDDDQPAEYTLGLAYDGTAFPMVRRGEFIQLSDRSGQICFGFIGGENGAVTMRVEPHATATVVGALSWYYPIFFLPGAAENDIMFRHGNRAAYQENKGSYLRNYTERYSDAKAVTVDALANYEEWKQTIQKWHDSYTVPASCSHIWFGSVASLITSTMYAVGGMYFEAEQPHGLVNTMDVSVYSTWIYLINWPEIERTDLEMFISSIPREGDTPGKVWHSLWADGAHYVEEAIYAVRVWRYALWSGDREFLKKAFSSVKMALEWIYTSEGLGSLINNAAGNQSYDAWKMPGIGAYVNNQWLYALFAYGRMCRELGEPCQLCGRELDEFLQAAVKEYNTILWDAEGGYWHAYKPNEHSNFLPYGSAVFSDQLFGHWAVALDVDSRGVLDAEMERAALNKIYTHNRIIEPERGYSCWSNGMMPVREQTVDIASDMEVYEHCGYHALSCWICAEMVVASMMGYLGMEKEAMDVVDNLAEGLGQNVLAAGEYNRSVDKDLNAVVLSVEPGKDTPRFPPYPRYKCTWEFLLRLLGMEMDFDTLRFAPFRSVDLEIKELCLAGVTLSVRVESGWTRCLVNGEETEPMIDRVCGQATLEFVR